MLKKKFTLLIFLFLTSCGYEAIHSKKNAVLYNFSINALSLTGDRDVNLKIKEKLHNYTLDEKDKNFTVKVDSVSNKIILGKDLSGDPTSFKITITITVETLTANNTKINLELVESFNYNNISNKFNLKKYERRIKRNLAESATNKIIFKLSNIQ